MPLSKHFGGHGEEVMANMTKQYGAKKAKSVFYATENKRKSGFGFGTRTSPAGRRSASRHGQGR